MSPAWQESTQTTSSGLKTPPVVTATDAPAGTEVLPATWVSVAVPDLGVMHAAVARPSATGPFPAVLVLHGTHGFAQQYVAMGERLGARWLHRRGRMLVFRNGGAAVNEVTPIPCPEIPPLAAGEYPEAARIADALVKATRALPGVRGDRLALVGHSRGAGATQQYLMAGGNVQAAILHSSGYGLRPWNRAAEFKVPILIMHGTADSYGENTRFAWRANSRCPCERTREPSKRLTAKDATTTPSLATRPAR